MLLADEFFLLALDDRTGRLRLAPRVFGLGLAGALLGELILERKITVRDDGLQVVDSSPPADALTHTTLDQLVAEVAEHPVKSWLAFLAQHSRAQVAQRLQRGGYIREETARRLWRVDVSYPPVDVNVAAMPWARLASGLRKGALPTWHDAVLAGLAMATGLDRHVLSTADAAARDYLRQVVEHLPPSEYQLVWHLHAAVGDAVLTGRT